MPLVIGIAGGTGSGKSTIARNIKSAVSPEESVVIIEMDSYYRDFSHLSYEQRDDLNFDHPDAIDFDLLVTQMHELMNGRAIQKPVYDFVHHARAKDLEQVQPAEIVILEGIMVFHKKEVRDLLDIKIFVDTDSDIRVFRRIRRDMESRGRRFESIRKRYYDMVKPMHAQFVEPSKRWADLVIPEGGENNVAIDVIVAKISRWLQENRRSAN